jgi:hypothetical protein
VRKHHPISSLPAVMRRFLSAAAMFTLVIGMLDRAQAQDQKKTPDAEKAFRPRTLDLLAIIDPGRDAVRGKWTRTDKELVCRDFIIKFSQAKLRHAIAAMMPNPNGGSFLWKVGVQEGDDFELMSKSAKAWKYPGLLKVNTMHTTIVQVRRDFVRCLLDNKELIGVRTNFEDLTIDNWNQMPDAHLLGVGCDDPTVFHAIWITEISGPGKVRTRDAGAFKKR